MKNRRALGFLAASTFVAIGLAQGCGSIDNGGKKTTTSSGAGGEPLTSASLTGGTTTGDDTSLAGGLAVSGSGTGAGGGCQHYDVKFKQDIPTIMVLVDRSGSMFDTMSWDPLKTAVLSVVQNLQSSVRFGFMSFTGVIGGTAAANTCPILLGTSGTNPIALNNYDAIKAAYDAASVKPATKLETPTELTIDTVIVPELLAVTETGPKYILLVTDGDPDHCDDGNPVCPRDGVVGAVQAAYSKGIGTILFGLGSATYVQHLKDVANAGAGAPVQELPNNAIHDQCAGVVRGTYAAVGGTTKYYAPTGTDSTELETQITAAVTGVQSCTFDLQGEIKVNLANAMNGLVSIDGASVPYDMANGWFMKTETELDFTGTSCDQLKKAKAVTFDFPCDAIIPQ